MLNVLRLSLAIFVGLSVVSCASIASKSIYPVSISGKPKGARVSIRNESGVKIYEGVTPASLTLPAGDGFFSAAKYTVTIKKEGYAEKRIFINGRYDRWFVGNLLLFHFFPVGMVIDGSNGAMWQLSPRFAYSLARQNSSLILKKGDQEVAISLLSDMNLTAEQLDTMGERVNPSDMGVSFE